MSSSSIPTYAIFTERGELAAWGSFSGQPPSNGVELAAEGLVVDTQGKIGIRTGSRWTFSSAALTANQAIASIEGQVGPSGGLLLMFVVDDNLNLVKVDSVYIRRR